jgi:branched-chain amino acid transport system permease protein
MMVLRPEGLIPSGRRKIELHEAEIEGEFIAREEMPQLYDVREGR